MKSTCLRQQGENTVCRLHKSLYRLKPSSRNWFSIFSTTIQNASYTLSKVHSFTAVLIYVDDILLTDNHLKEIQHLKTYLLEKSLIKDLENLKYFLGIEVSRFIKMNFYVSKKICFRHSSKHRSYKNTSRKISYVAKSEGFFNIKERSWIIQTNTDG